MCVGLGIGLIVVWLVKCFGELVCEEGLCIQGVLIFSCIVQFVVDVGIEVVILDEVKWLDIIIDGVDEFDMNLNLIKGGGGVYFQEKIVVIVFDQMIVIVDVLKKVEMLGVFFLLLEVIFFGW